MKRHDIRLRKQEFSASRIKQHKDYNQLMRKHQRISRNKTAVQTVAMVAVLIIISSIVYWKYVSRTGGNSLIEGPSIGQETIQKPSNELYEDRIRHVLGAKATPETGWEAYGLYLQENISFPLAENVDQITEGVVKVQILVSDLGEVKALRILEGMGAAYDDVAINLIKNGPKWNPGLIDGKPSEGAMVIPVYFQKPETK